MSSGNNVSYNARVELLRNSPEVNARKERLLNTILSGAITGGSFGHFQGPAGALVGLVIGAGAGYLIDYFIGKESSQNSPSNPRG